MRLGRGAALALAITALAPWLAGTVAAQAEEPEKFGASAHVAAPEAPREKVAGQREVIELRSTHGDSFSVIESVPSALPVFSGVPYLLIRGAPPSGTTTLYDGAPIPAFHHMALGPAIAHLSMVSSVRFHAGVSPARYGRHIGGVHVLEAPDVSPLEASSELELNAVDSQAMAATSGQRWIAGHVRYGYPSVWLDAVDAGVQLGYGDYQLRLVTPFGADAIATVHAFGSYDSLGETGEPQDDIVLSFHRLVGRYVRHSGDIEIGSALFVGYDRGELGQELTGSTFRVGPSLYGEREIDEDTRVRVGADMESKLADIVQYEEPPVPLVDENGQPTPESYLPQDQRAQSIDIGAEEFIDQSPLRDNVSRTAIGAFIELELFRTRLFRLEAGVRTDTWLLAGQREHAVDPRGVVRFVPSDQLELHAALGTAHQSVGSPVPVPGLADVEFDFGLQRAIQSELGVRIRDLLGMELEITGYYHRFHQTAFLELVLDCEGNSDSRVFDDRQPQFESICRDPGLPRADGDNYGVEFLLRPRWTKRLSGFATYTLGGANATAEDGTSFTPQADVRHLMNMVLGYDFGAGFRAGTRVHYRSGKSAVNTFYDRLSSRFEREELRLPAFFRADVFVSYAFQWFAPTTITAGVQNVTLSREATKRDCQIAGTGVVLCEIDYQPAIVLPNVGLRVEL
jgi:hypothetical protein